MRTLGKIAITDDNAPHLERMRHAADVAKLFGAPYIRMFSYFMPAGADPDGYRDEVITRIGDLAAIAEDAGVTLIHENEKEIFGDIPRRCLDIVEAVNSPALALTWDNANFVQCGVRPFTEAYPLIRPHLVYLQVKDARFADGEVTPAGEGDGEMRETLAALRDSGFAGFMSLEPHLDREGRGVVAAQHLPRRVPVGRGHHLVAPRAERPVQRHPRNDLVVGDQDSHGRSRRRLSRLVEEGTRAHSGAAWKILSNRGAMVASAATRTGSNCPGVSVTSIRVTRACESPGR